MPGGGYYERRHLSLAGARSGVGLCAISLFKRKLILMWHDFMEAVSPHLGGISRTLDVVTWTAIMVEGHLTRVKVSEIHKKLLLRGK